MVIIYKRILSYVLFSLSACVLANPSHFKGPYAGLNLGVAFGNNQVSTNTGEVTNTSYFSTPTDIYLVNSAGEWEKQPKAMTIDLQMGHDWVWKQITYGIALNYGWLPLSSSNTVNKTALNNINNFSVNTAMSTNWLFTLRGKFGYQRLLKFHSLLYLTGGLAVTKLKISNAYYDNSALEGVGSSESAQNQIGWTIGTGIEIAAFKNMSVNFEYLYIDIPSIKTTNFIFNTQGGFGIPEKSLASPFSTSGNFYANLLKVGLNYRFDE